MAQAQSTAEPPTRRAPRVGQKHYRDLAAARADLAQYKARLAELDFRKRSSELVDRAEVERVVARAFAAISQDLRSLADVVERHHGITDGKVLSAIDDSVDAALHTAHDSLAKLFPAPGSE